ncbi:MAG: hypothetical protein ACTHJK_01705 [Sphingomicrobium sp.]
MHDVDTKERRDGHSECDEGHPKLQRKGPNNKPWVIDVDVYLDKVEPPPDRTPTFHLDTCLPMDASGNISFSNRHRNGFQIRFNLWDNTTEGNYVFHEPIKSPTDPSKWALWSSKGPGCPPDNCNAQWEQFQSDHSEAGGLTLVVNNLNSELTYFGYTLRVTNNGTDFVNLDPGGTNMNGPTSLY